MFFFIALTVSRSFVQKEKRNKHFYKIVSKMSPMSTYKTCENMIEKKSLLISFTH